MNSPQSNTNHEEHNWINIIAEPTATDLYIAESTDVGMKTKEDHLQSRPNMSIKAWQDQEESIEDLSETNKQNRSLHHDHQTTG